jgi:[ribosomal protein S18]-alanine N-acetyltransferase
MRPMRWWDIAPVMAVERALFTDDAWSESMFWSELAQRETRHYLVVDGDKPGEVAAYCGLCAYVPHEAYVQTIAVAPSAQCRGLGRQLLLAMLTEADRLGCAHVDLEVRADNDVARRLYAHHGFVDIAVRRAYYQPSGIDAIVMRRERAA